LLSGSSRLVPSQIIVLVVDILSLGVLQLSLEPCDVYFLSLHHGLGGIDHFLEYLNFCVSLVNNFIEA
jgi:hypothetical protein